MYKTLLPNGKYTLDTGEPKEIYVSVDNGVDIEEMAENIFASLSKKEQDSIDDYLDWMLSGCPTKNRIILSIN